MMADVSCPGWINADNLAAPLTRMLGTRAAAEAWTCQRLAGSGRGVGTWRLRGDAAVGDKSREWALVLKGWAPTEENTHPDAWDWPNREAELYLSGNLEALPPGVRAPRCFDSLVREDGSIWIWLEDLGDAGHPRSLDDYVTAARHLGRFNGAFLAGWPLPAGQGLGRTWLARWVEAAAPEMALLLDGIDHPRVRAAYPPKIVETFGALWMSRRHLLDRLDRLPATFCHRDAFGRNLFLREDDAGDVETIAIDWEFAGIGFPGEDLTALVAATAMFMDIATEDIEPLERDAMTAYLVGLRETGWSGNPADVHTAYALSAALRFGVGMARMIVPLLLSDERLAAWAQGQGYAESEIVAACAAVNLWLCGLAEACLSGQHGASTGLLNVT